jgi:hypothetical protein
VLWGEVNTPFIPDGAPASTLYVYRLEIDTQSNYRDTITKVYDASIYGIAYNFQTAAWEDYGTRQAYGWVGNKVGDVEAPWFVEQYSWQVVLFNEDRTILGRFENPYDGWTP